MVDDLRGLGIVTNKHFFKSERSAEFVKNRLLVQEGIACQFEELWFFVVKIFFRNKVCATKPMRDFSLVGFNNTVVIQIFLSARSICFCQVFAVCSFRKLIKGSRSCILSQASNASKYVRRSSS